MPRCRLLLSFSDTSMLVPCLPVGTSTRAWQKQLMDVGGQQVLCREPDMLVLGR